MTEIPLMLTIDGSKGRAEVDKTRTSLDKFKDSGKQVEQQNARVTNSFDLMKRAAAGLAAGLSVQKIIQYSDTWKQLQGRLELATKSQGDFNSKQAQLYDLAQRNRQSLEGVYNLYNRLSMAVGNNAKAQQGLIGVTEAFAKGLAITGESAQAAQGAITQFSQGLATGFKAGGQELNSLMEQAPRVAKALADGLNQIGAASNATSANLKELAQKGILNVNNVVAALQSQLPKLTAEFEKIPRTVGQAITQLDNAFLKFVGNSAAISAGTNTLALAIGGLAENFDMVANAVLIVTGVYVARLIPALITSTASFIANELAAANAAAGYLGFAGAANVATTAVGGLGGVVTVLSGLLTLLPIVAVIALFVSMATATGTATAAMEGYNKTVAEAQGLNAEFATASAKRRDEIKQHTLDNINAYKAELSSLTVLVREYQNMSSLSLGFAEITGRARNVLSPLSGGAIDPGLSPGEVATRVKGVKAAIQELDRVYAEFGKTVGNGSQITDEAAKNAKKLAESIDELHRSANQQLAATSMNELEKTLFSTDIAVGKLTRSYGKLNAEQQKQVDVTKEIQEQIYYQQKLNDLVEDTLTPLEKYNKKMDEFNTLWKEAKTPQQVQAITRSIEQLRDEANPLAEAFKNAATGIQDGFTGMFRDVLDGTGGFRSFTAKMLDAFKDMIAQMLTLAITNPIIIPIVQSVGSAMGLSGGSISAVTSQLGGGAGVSTALSGGSSIFSGLMNGFNTPIFSSGSMIANGIDSIGSFLGLSGGMAQGPTLSGAAGYNLGVSSNFTPAAGLAGLAGGLLSSAVFGGGMGNTIGSTIGGIAGTFLPVPILGSAIGSFLGGAIGSLFGKKKPSSKLATGTLDLMNGGLTRGGYLPGDKKFDQTNYDEVGTLAAIAARIAALTGGATGSLSIASGNRNGLEGGFDGMSTTYGENVNGFLKAIITGIAERGKEVSDPLRKAIENIDWTNAKDNIEKIITDLTTAANYERVRDQFNAGLSGQLLSPYGRARMEAQQNLSAMLAQAQAVGGSIDLVYKVHEQTLLEIEKQYSTVNQEMQRTAENAANLSKQFAGLADSLGNALFSLRTGNLSALSPLDKLNAARGEFTSVAGAARLGDAAAMQRLPEVANTFLSLSRQYNASTEAFARDFAAVEAALTDARATAQRQVGLQQEIANNTLAQVNATTGLSSILLASQAARSLSSGDFSGRSFGAANGNQNVVNNLGAITGAGMMGTVEALLQTFTFGVTPGQNRRSQFFDLFPAQNEAFIAEAKRLGIPGFAAGGMTPVNRPFMVGENGPEIMTFGRSGMVQPVAGNDNKAFEQISRQLQALIVVTAKGLSQTNDRLAAAVSRLDNIDATNRISAA